ncbi:MAG: alkaline phosphatase D family protein, partial [Chitinophagaceae bacterium]|nr:alkaline phosphatase D family protein [Rubrivivax sp.]
MGRLRQTPRRVSGTSRRGFFKASGSAAAALVAAPMLSLAAERSSRAGLFQHGVASGDPLADRVILWTRVTPATPLSVLVVTYVVATDPGLTQVVFNGTTKTNPARDYTVKVDPAGLSPATTYYYRFFCNGETSPVGRTRTLPTGSAQRLRIGVASCSNHAYGYFNAYRRMAERADLDMVLHLGDYLYEYGPNVYGSVRTPEPPNEMVVLSDYRLRHAQYKRDTDLQELHRQHPVIAIWDDHEITNDSWVDGAQNHTEGAEGSWPERVNQGLQAYYEWMPVRIPDA